LPNVLPDDYSLQLSGPLFAAVRPDGSMVALEGWVACQGRPTDEHPETVTQMAAFALAEFARMDAES
jgi:hypothetical protein